jgi:hypothetical protein
MDLPQVIARIPLLQRIGTDLIKVMKRKEQIVAQYKKPGRGRESAETDSVVALKEELRVLSDRLTELREEVHALGGSIANNTTATLEFLGEVDGCIAWFSWQPGEDTIQSWRPVDGEAGERFPLPGFPKNKKSVENTVELDECNETENVE